MSRKHASHLPNTRPFRHARGLLSPHVQTIYPALFRRLRVKTARERWELPDGDFIDVERLFGTRADPCVILLHGLEGSSQSGYIQETLRLLTMRHVNAVALNMRSCSGELNRLPGAYHSGDYRDLAYCMQRLDEEGFTGPRYVAGYSVGGNIALKYLANDPSAKRIARAAAVGVPYDLEASVTAIDTRGGIFRVYRQWFMGSLRRKAIAKAFRFPHLLDTEAVARVRTIRAFDEAVIAPLFGFRSAHDYYEKATASRELDRITTPTLLLSAEDDPLAPASLMPKSVADNPHLHVVRAETGGHIGFVEFSALRPKFWGEEQVVTFLLG